MYKKVCYYKQYFVYEIIIESWAICRQFAAKLLASRLPNHWLSGGPNSYARVAIHIRRGNFLSEERHGFATPNADYFHRAMRYFATRIRRVQFVAISQDVGWTMSNIVYNATANPKSEVNVTYVFGNAAWDDMAVMAACDHVIVSSGSYGWLGAWLANGTTIYFGGYPRNGSWLGEGFVNDDYYPPTWIKM